MTTKVMLSFPDEFLAEVDRVAREEHRSRSELVREALRLYIGKQHRPGGLDPGREGRQREGSVERSSSRTRENREEAGVGVPWPGDAHPGDSHRLADRDREVAREFRRRMAQVVPVLDLRVFGSRARGDAAPGADLDLFIELESATPEVRGQISEIAWEVGFEMDRVISTVVVTRDELEQGAMGANPLVREVEREGVRP